MVRSVQGGLLAAGLLLACDPSQSIPGELGRFKFDAAPQTIGCPFREIPDGGFFDFEATLSVVDAGAALTFHSDNNDNIRRPGTFDGQRFEFTYPGPSDDPVLRIFEIGACDDRFLVEETLRTVFLTEAQFGLVMDVDGGCPSDPEALFDAGGPIAPDAGILPPSRGPDGGFDAQWACGVLIENVRPEKQCDFSPCTLTYRIKGERIITP
jgi:hypothetical protein